MGVRHARKHLAGYAETGGALTGPERTALLTTTDPETALALLERAFAGAEPVLTLAAKAGLGRPQKRRRRRPRRTHWQNGP